MKKEIEAFVNAANEQELEAAWNNLSAEEQRVFEQLMEEDSPEDEIGRASCRERVSSPV